jgi:hypothetical protein
MSEWRITAFSEQHAMGKVADADGVERSFPIEAWVPCDPANAVQLSLSDAHRHLLIPRVGEPVDVELRGERIVRVTRRQPIELATAIFAEWFAKLCAIVPAMTGWNAGTWQAIEGELDEVPDLDEIRNDPAPSRLEYWWLLFAWIRDHGRGGDETIRRLGWLHLEPAPSCIAIATDDEPVYVDAALAKQLIAARLATAR